MFWWTTSPHCLKKQSGFWRGLEFIAQDVPTDSVHGFGKDVHYMMSFVRAANTEL